MTPNTVLDITQSDNTATRVGDKLKGCVAFVTGGTRGIGAAICRSLASQGATLAAPRALTGSPRDATVRPRCGTGPQGRRVGEQAL